MSCLACVANSPSLKSALQGVCRCFTAETCADHRSVCRCPTRCQVVAIIGETVLDAHMQVPLSTASGSSLGMTGCAGHDVLYHMIWIIACMAAAAVQGTMAEYLTLPVANLHPVPDEVPDQDACFAEPLAAACRVAEQQV